MISVNTNQAIVTITLLATIGVAKNAMLNHCTAAA